jgi:hypothetical protein
MAVYCFDCHLFLGLLCPQIGSLSFLIVLHVLALPLCLPNSQQLWQCLAPQLHKYLGEWTLVVLVPLVGNAVETLVCDSNVPQLEVHLLGPEVIMFLLKMLINLVFSCSHFSLQRKMLGTTNWENKNS